ncbi:MAG: HNH endonuclease [Lachnospiraceae bacterium]|nr:HNH endonuclease [Lachnospiraceae bacterium]
MTQDELEQWINQLIAKNKLSKFYKCKEWRQLSDDVMKENNYECQKCKARGVHATARSVHHVQWVRRHPRLALSRTYVYNGTTYNNLIPLCEDCHNKEHPEKGKGLKKRNKNKFVNEERW